MVSAESFPGLGRRWIGSSSSQLLCGVLVSCLLLLGGCGLGGSSGEIEETVDVQEPIPTVDTSEDVQEAERKPELSGVLPDDFPDGLPVYLPSSVVDLAEGSVTLLSPHSRQRVQEEYRQVLRAAGWAVGGEGAILELTKSGRKVQLVYAEGGPGTAYRIDY